MRRLYLREDLPKLFIWGVLSKTLVLETFWIGTFWKGKIGEKVSVWAIFGKQGFRILANFFYLGRDLYRRHFYTGRRRRNIRHFTFGDPFLHLNKRVLQTIFTPPSFCSESTQLWVKPFFLPKKGGKLPLYIWGGPCWGG